MLEGLPSADFCLLDVRAVEFGLARKKVEPVPEFEQSVLGKRFYG
jgi:hypothetical protein